MTDQNTFSHFTTGLWWIEDYLSGRAFSAYRIEKFLFDEQSEYQRIRIFDTQDYGRGVYAG